MLRLFESYRGLEISNLQQIYEDSAGNLFYEDTLDFLQDADTAYATWCVNGSYVCALRWQPFRAGYLIAGLETMPSQRNNGYAKQLLRSVLEHYSSDGTRKVYSHIHKTNHISAKVHSRCGFKMTDAYAYLLDGSVSREYYTFTIQI